MSNRCALVARVMCEGLREDGKTCGVCCVSLWNTILTMYLVYWSLLPTGSYILQRMQEKPVNRLTPLTTSPLTSHHHPMKRLWNRPLERYLGSRQTRSAKTHSDEEKHLLWWISPVEECCVRECIIYADLPSNAAYLCTIPRTSVPCGCCAVPMTSDS
ncbi:hypothetical protein OBBRIDRAFT_374034 [Obba rivulosa]|uniref:Uncharacterized protein n=1 Tax=Obba rivulosa TaxID=1052685 RepID=A0A8E2AT81_9APHY|nr:hypothetical protein OBBRIDRAFT_374034 [Obba rivulosa]